MDPLGCPGSSLERQNMYLLLNSVKIKDSLPLCEMVQCKLRIISPLPGASEERLTNIEEVEIEAEKDIFNLVCGATSSRSRPLISTILEKYESRRDAIMLFQTLAYVMEHCRFTHKRYLFIYHKALDPCPDVKLDLEELISFPKQCCNRGCIKDGLISCSLCKVACWCGPDCLEADFSSHKIACTVAEHILQELQL